MWPFWLPGSGPGAAVRNDLTLGNMHLLTGPNMAARVLEGGLGVGVAGVGCGVGWRLGRAGGNGGGGNGRLCAGPASSTPSKPPSMP